MREIKFRAFDNGQMVEPTFHEFCDINDQFENAIFDDVIMMQYTGLKDKNDVEIYEGDIVNLYETRKKKYDVPQSIFFTEGMFCVGKLGDMETPLHQETDTVRRKRGLNMIEVIGNIHENPELLKANE